MENLERMIMAGVRIRDAIEIITWYRMQGDDYGLEQFIDEIERHSVQAV